MPLSSSGLSTSTLDVSIYNSFDDDYKESLSVTSHRDDLLQDLTDAQEEAKEINWDGYGAAPANIDAYIISRKFLKSLPDSIPDPKVDVTPQGDFVFFWRRRPRHMVSLTINGSGEIAYAAKFGHTRKTGTTIFAGYIPRHLLAELFHLFA